LYESFAALRREEEARVPPISAFTLNSGAHRRRSPVRLVAATISLATVFAVAAWLHIEHERSDRGREQAAVSITAWKPSTDFLLETPGRELLHGVPAIGESHSVAIQPSPGESHRPNSKHVVP
jgi:hypothetical protein